MSWLKCSYNLLSLLKYANNVFVIYFEHIHYYDDQIYNMDLSGLCVALNDVQVIVNYW